MIKACRKQVLNDQECMQLCDTWHGFFDRDAKPFDCVQRDIDYVRGFAHGVEFMRRHGHELPCKRFDRVWETIMNIRCEMKRGRTCLPLMGWLEERFRLFKEFDPLGFSCFRR